LSHQLRQIVARTRRLSSQRCSHLVATQLTQRQSRTCTNSKICEPYRLFFFFFLHNKIAILV
jgi:hypothetical protein